MKQTTKEAIQASFRTLLLAKSLDKITVRDIVEDCGLTRNTFYYHYEDIYDLFDDYLDSRMYEVWTKMPEDKPWDEMLLELLQSVFETPQMGRHIFFSKKQDSMRQYLNKILTAMLDRLITNQGEDLEVSLDDRRMICDACCQGLYGLLEQWLTGPEASVMWQRLARTLKCFEGGIHAALRYCADHPQHKEANHEKV